MIYIFALWATPLLIFWGWYFLSYYDFNFGYMILSRQANDMVFQIYGDVLGMDPKLIPWLAAKACIIDTMIILAIWAFRRRRKIAEYFRARRRRFQAGTVSGSEAYPAPPAE